MNQFYTCTWSQNISIESTFCVFVTVNQSTPALFHLSTVTLHSSHRIEATLAYQVSKWRHYKSRRTSIKWQTNIKDKSAAYSPSFPRRTEPSVHLAKLCPEIKFKNVKIRTALPAQRITQITLCCAAGSIIATTELAKKWERCFYMSLITF